MLSHSHVNMIFLSKLRKNLLSHNHLRLDQWFHLIEFAIFVWLCLFLLETCFPVQRELFSLVVPLCFVRVRNLSLLASFGSAYAKNISKNLSVDVSNEPINIPQCLLTVNGGLFCSNYICNLNMETWKHFDVLTNITKTHSQLADVYSVIED